MQCAHCWSPAKRKAKHGTFQYPLCSSLCSKLLCEQLLIGPKIGEAGADDALLPVAPGDWESLPDEAKLAVLGKIPLLRLLQRARVSPEWNALIKDDYLWHGFYHQSIVSHLGAPDRKILETWRGQTLHYLNMFDYILTSGGPPPSQAGPPLPPPTEKRPPIRVEQVIPGRMLQIRHASIEVMQEAVKRIKTKLRSIIGTAYEGVYVPFYLVLPDGSHWTYTGDSNLPPRAKIQPSDAPPSSSLYIVVEIRVSPLSRSDEDFTVTWRRSNAGPAEGTISLDQFSTVVEVLPLVVKFIPGRSNPALPVIQLIYLNGSYPVSGKWYVLNPQALAAVFLGKWKPATPNMRLDVSFGQEHISAFGNSWSTTLKDLQDGNGELNETSIFGSSGDTSTPGIILNLSYGKNLKPTIGWQLRDLEVPAIFLLRNALERRPRVLRPDILPLVILNVFGTSDAQMEALALGIQDPPQFDPPARHMLLWNSGVHAPANALPFTPPVEAVLLEKHGFVLANIDTRVLLQGSTAPPMQLPGQPLVLPHVLEDPSKTPLTLRLVFKLSPVTYDLSADNALSFTMKLTDLTAENLEGPPRPEASMEFFDVKLFLDRKTLVGYAARLEAEALDPKIFPVAKWIEDTKRSQPDIVDPPNGQWPPIRIVIASELMGTHFFLGRYFPRTGQFLRVRDPFVIRYSNTDRTVLDAGQLGIAQRIM
jgi:hypothetical protein